MLRSYKKHFNHTRKNTESFSPFDLSTKKKGYFLTSMTIFVIFRQTKPQNIL